MAMHQNHVGALKNPDAHIISGRIKSESLGEGPDISIFYSSPNDSHKNQIWECGVLSQRFWGVAWALGILKAFVDDGYYCYYYTY